MGDDYNTAYPLPEPMTLDQIRAAALREDPAALGMLLTPDQRLQGMGDTLMKNRLSYRKQSGEELGSMFDQAMKIAQERRLQEQNAITAQALQLGKYQYVPDLFGLPGRLNTRTGEAGFIPPGEAFGQGGGGGAPAPGGGDVAGMIRGLPPEQQELAKASFRKRLPPAIQNELSIADDAIRNLGVARAAIQNNPQAFGLGSNMGTYAGIMGETVSQLTQDVQNSQRAPGVTKARAAVFQQAYETINRLAGTALSMHERGRIEQFTPAPNDPPRVLLEKVEDALRVVQEIREDRMRKNAPLLWELEQAPPLAPPPAPGMNLGVHPIPPPRGPLGSGPRPPQRTAGGPAPARPAPRPPAPAPGPQGLPGGPPAPSAQQASQAEAWARANPNDPRAAKILRILGRQ